MFIRVETEALFAAAASLRATLSLMGDWDREKSSLLGAAPAAGHRVMSGGIEQFCNEWDYGFGHIAGDLSELADALEVTAQAYADTDGAIADAAGGAE